MTTFARRRPMVSNTISSSVQFPSYHPQKEEFLINSWEFMIISVEEKNCRQLYLLYKLFLIEGFLDKYFERFWNRFLKNFSRSDSLLFGQTRGSAPTVGWGPRWLKT